MSYALINMTLLFLFKRLTLHRSSRSQPNTFLFLPPRLNSHNRLIHVHQPDLIYTISTRSVSNPHPHSSHLNPTPDLHLLTTLLPQSQTNPQHAKRRHQKRRHQPLRSSPRKAQGRRNPKLNHQANNTKNKTMEEVPESLNPTKSVHQPTHSYKKGRKEKKKSRTLKTPRTQPRKPGNSLTRSRQLGKTSDIAIYLKVPNVLDHSIPFFPPAGLPILGL
ncbi:hypothetical protein BKA65DRAFT_264001 [Rhexocercosporidium sp. MPI-PUGE-AT-0058]|nr:hypothetical protein BKA65DRAFT_264001 [Rhexocercosporidium sp. MPI-PUGE-AT-0058]